MSRRVPLAAAAMQLGPSYSQMRNRKELKSGWTRMASSGPHGRSAPAALEQQQPGAGRASSLIDPAAVKKPRHRKAGRSRPSASRADRELRQQVLELHALEASGSCDARARCMQSLEVGESAAAIASSRLRPRKN
jgi:hypothetical protein